MLPLSMQEFDKTPLIRPRPTKLSGIVLIITGVIFLAFSILPFSMAGEDGGQFIILFGVIWVLVCLSFIVYGVYILTSKKPSSGIVFDIEGSTASTNLGSRNDFDLRIRKLEKLKEDRLITEEEYKSKRAEIMKEPW
jgi:hypothetical protein